MSLRRKLASFGFESNDDFDFALRCLSEAEQTHIRTTELVGHMVRRKTAFAHALGLALEFPNRLYHDFTRPETAEATAVKFEDNEAIDTGDKRLAKPPNAFERVLTEACAYSESARTVLVLDQLQACEFAEQMKLYSFLQTGDWTVGASSMIAHKRNLLVLLISTEPLYHSLQKCCFRIFVDAGGTGFDFKPDDFALGPHTQALIDAYAHLFEALKLSPTRSEFERILKDSEARVRSIDQLRTCLFGRVENLERAPLYAPVVETLLHAVVNEIAQLLGVEEVSY
jgi:hypothetical protein